MSTFLEVIIYLIIAFGIMTITITAFNRKISVYDKYMRLKRDDARAKVTVIVEGMSEQDTNRIGWIIQKGKFEDIYDIVNEYEVLTKED